MSPIVSTFLFEAANFLVLAALLGWLFFKPVRQALRDRRAEFESNNQHAERMLAEAKKTQQEAGEAKHRLQSELQQLRSSELEAARRQAEQIVAEARSDAEREREMSRRRAASISEAQRDTLAEAAAAAAAETVGKLLEQIGGDDLHNALIKSACQRLSELPRDHLVPVIVESSRSLSSDQVKMLNEAVGAEVPPTEFRKIKDLGDGVRVLAASGLVDATVKGLEQFAAHSLSKQMSSRRNNHNPLRQNSHV